MYDRYVHVQVHIMHMAALRSGQYVCIVRSIRKRINYPDILCKSLQLKMRPAARTSNCVPCHRYAIPIKG